MCYQNFLFQFKDNNKIIHKNIKEDRDRKKTKHALQNIFKSSIHKIKYYLHNHMN